MRIIVLFLFLFSITVISAQTKRVFNTIRISEEPNIDGVLDDAVWKQGEWSGDFTQREPNDGAKPSQPTFFKIFYSDKYIFVAFKALDASADSIDSRLLRHDNIDGDLVAIHFDSYYDKRTAFSFFVNAAGVKSDVLFSDGGEKEDPNWNPIWYAKTSKDENGWYAEIKIPLSQLRFSKRENKIWGLEASRQINRLDELSLWQAIPRTSSSWVYNFGELHGIDNLEPKRIMELAPYALAGLQTQQKEAGNPYITGNKFLYDFGVDGKIGVTNDLVLDFTINPDFGQVEADPSEVNLSAFETYQREQRPFFVEGSNITNFKITPGDHDAARDNLFYSRRIGRSPQYYPDTKSGEYVNFPTQTRILGALKLTGKTQKGLSVGIMESITKREFADISYEGKERKQVVEPLTNYFVARVQKDINKGNTIIGGEFTSANRQIEDSNLLFLAANAFSGGIDFAQYWKKRKYYFKVNLVGSSINGDSTALIARQTSSQRYFQRTDADYVNVDSSLTQMNGHGGNIALGKQVESGWSYNLNLSWRSPNLSLNDIGYLRNTDKIMQSVTVSYNFTVPKLFYREISSGISQWNGWDFGGKSIFNGVFVWLKSTFKNNYEFVIRSMSEFNIHDNYKLRGGPTFFSPGQIFVRVNLESNSTKKFYWDIGSRQKWGYNGSGRLQSFDAGFTYRPMDALRLAFHPNYSFASENLQYVETVDANGNTDYLLSRIDRNTLHLSFYIDLSLSPNLTIQYYGAPFIATGKYSEFKRVNKANASNYADRFYQFAENEVTYNSQNDSYTIDEGNDGQNTYSIGNPDFNFKEFQSNLVLRWEFKPGSMLYLVWTQNKMHDDGFSSFAFSDDMSHLFGVVPFNVFMVKFSYRFYR